jgi:hypothetical protein
LYLRLKSLQKEWQTSSFSVLLEPHCLQDTTTPVEQIIAVEDFLQIEVRNVIALLLLALVFLFSIRPCQPAEIVLW